MRSRFRTVIVTSVLGGLAFAPGAVMAGDEKDQAHAGEGAAHQSAQQQPMDRERDLAGPAEDVQESVEVIQQLKEQEPDLANRLADAKGVFIIPDYVTAALLLGGSGGEGVMMSKQNGEWGNPGFYDIGNIDIGAQAGAAAGSIVMLLMTDQAVENFHTDTDFALTAQAGLTIINWSAQAPATTEEGDALVWSDTEGLLGEASVGVGGISWDEEESRNYYNQDVRPEEVLAGNVQNPNANVLQSEFAEFTTKTPEPETDSY